MFKTELRLSHRELHTHSRLARELVVAAKDQNHWVEKGKKKHTHKKNKHCRHTQTNTTATKWHKLTEQAEQELKVWLDTWSCSLAYWVGIPRIKSWASCWEGYHFFLSPNAQLWAVISFSQSTLFIWIRLFIPLCFLIWQVKSCLLLFLVLDLELRFRMVLHVMAWGDLWDMQGRTLICSLLFPSFLEDGVRMFYPHFHPFFLAVRLCWAWGEFPQARPPCSTVSFSLTESCLRISVTLLKAAWIELLIFVCVWVC